MVVFADDILGECPRLETSICFRIGCVGQSEERVLVSFASHARYKHGTILITPPSPSKQMIYTFYPLLDSAPLALKAQGVQPRAVLMSALQVRPPSPPLPSLPSFPLLSNLSLQLLWTTRLTYHATRRDFFDFSSEDYRWLVFRNWVQRAPVLNRASRVVLGVFNFAFIGAFVLSWGLM